MVDGDDTDQQRVISVLKATDMIFGVIGSTLAIDPVLLLKCIMSPFDLDATTCTPIPEDIPLSDCTTFTIIAVNMFFCD